MKPRQRPPLELVRPDKTAPQKGPRVTSYDVAALAGVSQSAVSRCFKPGASVSKKMRARVMKAARALGYQPNAIARSLITRRSNLAGVILSDFTNLHYPEVLFELNQSFSNRGVHIMLFTLRRERDIDAIIEQVFQYRVDGVVLAATLLPRQIDDFERRGIPLVCFNRNIQDQPVNSVCCDQIGGERMLVNALVNAGHKSFGFIAGPDDSLVSVQRTTGARDRLRELGLDDIPVAQGDYSYESGLAGVKKLIKHKPDAIICANDVMAMGCMDALRREYHMEIPKDISVVGFDGVAPALWAGYDLTTIRQPVKQMSEAAVEMIMARVDQPDMPPEMRVFSGLLCAGASARTA